VLAHNQPRRKPRIHPAQVGGEARARPASSMCGEAHNNIGIIWTERGDHKSALTAFLRAVALDATHAGWFNNLGNAYVELFRFAEAETAFDRGLALNPFDADAWSVR
jgi:tetratricopeptide (TPR) repeat protein